MRKCIVLLAVAVAACATNEPLKTSEVTRNGRTAAFVQNGRVPVNYTIGAVDGRTSWANYSIMGERLNAPKNGQSAGAITVTGKAVPDAVANLGLDVTSHIGKSIADASMKDDPAYYDRLLAAMVGSREFTTEIGPQMLKLAASSLGLPFDTQAIRTLDKAQRLEDANGKFLPPDPGTDLVVVFTFNELMLSEKPSSRGLKAVFTAGMYDKEVMPFLIAEFAVYRREGSGLKRTWADQCRNDFNSDAPAAEWTDLRADPRKAGPVFDQTLARLVKHCAGMLSKRLVAG